jgi:O-acetyl-ADP-ribose deacetylase (regulator of RNase III)
VNGKSIRLEKGDLTALAIDAFVFYAREDFDFGSGFGTAIKSRGGAPVKKETDAIGQIGMGQAVMTSAGGMQARHIIHACGPKFHEPELEAKLRKCMQSALQVADKAGLKTVAFPPMGAGFYGVPLDLCAKAMLDEIRRFLEGQTSIAEVIICVLDTREFVAFETKLKAN